MCKMAVTSHSCIFKNLSSHCSWEWGQITSNFNTSSAFPLRALFFFHHTEKGDCQAYLIALQSIHNDFRKARGVIPPQNRRERKAFTFLVVWIKTKAPERRDKKSQLPSLLWLLSPQPLPTPLPIPHPHPHKQREQCWEVKGTVLNFWVAQLPSS